MKVKIFNSVSTDYLILTMFTILLWSSPVMASLASNTETFALTFVQPILVAVAILGVTIGCATWALSSNEAGKENAKKAVMACAFGLSAPYIINSVRGIFG